MVHEAFKAKFAPQVPPAVPVGRENGCGVPPPKVNVPPVRATLPVFFTVRVWAALTVPVAQFPKANGFGVTVALGAGFAPVPDSATGELITGMLAVTVAVPLN